MTEIILRVVYVLTTLSPSAQVPEVLTVQTDTVTSVVPASFYEANYDLYCLPEVEVVRIDTI